MFGDILLSLSKNDPGIGTTCMSDFVENRDLVEISAFGAECARPDMEEYKKGFTQDYANNVPGKMKYNCECSVENGHNGYAVWACSAREESDIETPPRNLMQTKDILFNLTDLKDNNHSSTNAWLLGKR